MAFIDGNHDYEAVSRDCRIVLPLLQNGGILALHDTTGGSWAGIEQCVAELMSNTDLRHLETRNTITAFEKV